MKTTTTSGNLSLNKRDLFRGLIMAVLVPVITIISQSLEAGTLKFDWNAILIAALSGFVGYLVKNFLSPATIVVEAPKETVQAVKEGDAKVSVQRQL